MKNQITILDMLFEKRNKDYGAYYLRTKYSSHLMRAAVLGTLPVFFLVFSSFMYYRSQPKKIIEDGGVIITLTDILPPVLPKTEDPEPPKEQVWEQEVIATVKSVTPEPVEDDLAVEVPIPTFEELEDVIIANITAPGIKLSESKGQFAGEIGRTSDTEIDTKPPVIPKEPEILDYAEILPSFGDNQSEMYQWLGKNLRYPRAAQASNTQGIVFVAFVVEKDGAISNTKVVKGIGFGCDEEAIKTINKMPKWNPGMQNGKAVRVRFTIPIKFKLN